jgi:hypothetical protein
MHENCGSRRLLEFLDAAHVVDVRVRRNNAFGAQLVTGEDLLNSLDTVAGINHDGFSTRPIAKDRTVAGQHPHRKNFMNHVGPSALSYSNPHMCEYQGELFGLRLAKSAELH